MYARWRSQSARPLRTSYAHAELLAALKRELPHEIDLPPEAVCWTEEQLRAMIKNTPTSARETAEAKRVPQPQAMAKGTTLGLLAQLDAEEEYDMVNPPPPYRTPSLTFAPTLTTNPNTNPNTTPTSTPTPTSTSTSREGMRRRRRRLTRHRLTRHLA